MTRKPKNRHILFLTSLFLIPGLTLAAYLVADQATKLHFNQSLAPQIVIIPGLALLTGLALGSIIGLGFHQPLIVAWLTRACLLAIILAFCFAWEILALTPSPTNAPLQNPVKDIPLFNLQPANLAAVGWFGPDSPPPDLRFHGKTIKSPGEISRETHPLPAEKSRSDSADKTPHQWALPRLDQYVRLVIPIIEVDTEVIYIPYANGTWDISRLGQAVGWLGSISGRENYNNVVLAGHIALRYAGDGPFRHLRGLSPGDRILVYTPEKVYTYQVSSKKGVEINEIAVTYDTTKSQLTLLTCTAYNVETKVYDRRLVVTADLLKTETTDLHHFVMRQ